VQILNFAPFYLITIKELNGLIKELKKKGFTIELMCSLSNQNYQNILDTA